MPECNSKLGLFKRSREGCPFVSSESKQYSIEQAILAAPLLHDLAEITIATVACISLILSEPKTECGVALQCCRPRRFRWWKEERWRLALLV